MSDDSLEIVISRTEIQQRVAELAQEISRDYAGRPLTLLGVMTGSLFFMADLMRQLKIPHQAGALQASSYEGTATQPGTLRVCLDYLPCLKNRDVLLIDDILDTGQTLQHLLRELLQKEPASLKTAVLLWKQQRTRYALTPDYLGFPIEDQFVVGYGLDYNDDHRHLPDICILRR